MAGLAVLLLAPVFAIIGRSHLAGATTAQETAAYVAPPAISLFPERPLRPLPVHDPQVGVPVATATPRPVAPPRHLPVLRLPRVLPLTTPAAALDLPPGPVLAPGSIEGVIRAAAARHGVSGNWMVKIAMCESGLRPHAFNPVGPYYGLFQFLLSTFRAHGGTDIWDPLQQAEIAATMLAHGGAHAWGCA
jgi:Transglycosylase-like domain